MTARLWDIPHPYYAAEGHRNDYDSFEEMSASINTMDEDLNFVYRWDWFDAAAAHNDDLYLADEPRTKQYLKITVIQQRKCRFTEHLCPIRHDQEAAVIAWLSSDRIAGALRRTWAPILDDGEVGDTGSGTRSSKAVTAAEHAADVAYWRERALGAERRVTELETRTGRH